MTPKEFRERLGANAWHWDLIQFAQRASLDPQAVQTREKFRAFVRAAEALGQFDDRLIEIVVLPPAEEAAA